MYPKLLRALRNDFAYLKEKRCPRIAAVVAAAAAVEVAFAAVGVLVSALQLVVAAAGEDDAAGNGAFAPDYVVAVDGFAPSALFAVTVATVEEEVLEQRAVLVRSVVLGKCLEVVATGAKGWTS